MIAEIRRDLAANYPMNRLLQGDVGSGKTVVAIAAMLLAAEAGYQAAFMAPTQILAEQHYDVLRRWLEPLGLRLSLRTAARQEDSGPLPLFARNAQNLGSTGFQPVRVRQPAGQQKRVAKFDGVRDATDYHASRNAPAFRAAVGKVTADHDLPRGSHQAMCHARAARELSCSSRFGIGRITVTNFMRRV